MATHSHSVRRVKVTARERGWFNLPPQGPLSDGVGNTGPLAEDELEVEDQWVEVDVDDRWRAAFRLFAFQGQPAVAEVRLMPRDNWPTRKPGEWRAERLGLFADQLAGARSGPSSFTAVLDGVTAQILRRVPLRAIVQYTRAFQSTAPSPPESAKGSTRRRADSWPDRRYAQIAAAYVKRVNADSPHPVQDVARRRKLSVAQVRDAIRAARVRGLLTPTRKQGRAGGDLTPEAERLLASQRRSKQDRGGEPTKLEKKARPRKGTTRRARGR